MSVRALLAKVARTLVQGHPKTAAVILAGGSGSRMGSDLPKQRMLILGESVLMHSVRAFAECEWIDSIVVVSKKEEISVVREELKEIQKVSCVVRGGKTRQESAGIGFEAIPPAMKYVAIHDACRCLITTEQIREVLREAYLHGAACAGTPVADTLKQVSDSGFVSDTPDRSLFWAAQTPQVFGVNLYRCAYYTAQKNGWQGTDDSSLVEKTGQKVKMVDCTSENRKITYPVDLQIAAAVLQKRRIAGTENSEGKKNV